MIKTINPSQIDLIEPGLGLSPELRARILIVDDEADRKLKSAARNRANSDRFLHVYPLTLDRQKRLTTLVDESPARMIELTKGEASVLTLLMMHPNQVLSCHELVVKALGYEVDEAEAESVIRPYIFRLRRKLEPGQKPSLIRTVRRRGYRYIAGQA
jgi:DNA-binding response OmpR family regulator